MKKTTKKTTVTAKPVTVKAVATKTPVKKAPAKKKTAAAAEAPLTTINARIRVAFGDHLYARGEGGELSWNHGVALDCIADDLWTLSIKGVTAPVTFKLLVNDLNWSQGNDYTVEPGQSVTVTPSF